MSVNMSNIVESLASSKLISSGGNGVHVSQKASTPRTRGPLWKLSAWWTTEFSPVYANPTSLNKDEEGQMVKDTDAGDSVSVKTPGGRQRETNFLLSPRIWLVRQ